MSSYTLYMGAAGLKICIRPLSIALYDVPCDVDGDTVQSFVALEDDMLVVLCHPLIPVYGYIEK
jgi:hypothetical protein